MILYNVTLFVEEAIHEEFREWLTRTHIPEVLQTGLFVKHHFLKLLSEEENAAQVTYAVQYFLNNIADFVQYTENYAPALQEKTKARFGEKVLAFRTLLEMLEEGQHPQP
ncbi:MAG: DUF4286 family protein [Microscillaceae bacterium]